MRNPPPADDLSRLSKLSLWQRFSFRTKTVLAASSVLVLMVVLLSFGWSRSRERSLNDRWLAQVETVLAQAESWSVQSSPPAPWRPAWTGTDPSPEVLWVGRGADGGGFESLFGRLPEDVDMGVAAAELEALGPKLLAATLPGDRVFLRRRPELGSAATSGPWAGIFSKASQTRQLQQERRMLWGLAAAALILGVLLLRLVIYRLDSPLQRLVRIAQLLPAGEDPALEFAGRNELGFLEEALQTVTTRLTQLLSEQTTRLAEVEEKHQENLRLYAIAQHEIQERRAAEAALSTERVRLARRVRDRTADLSAVNAKLAKTAKSKDEFLASMSHELRTPLNAILGLSEALRQQTYGPLTEKQVQFLQDIEDSGRHLLALINDILDVARVGAENLQLELQTVNVAEVGRASIALVKQSAIKKRIRVEEDFDPAVELLEADIRRLKQILVNLLSNAVKFTPEGGRVELQVRGDAESHIAHFSVVDTGIGIAQEDLKRLFQPFVQLDGRLARQYEGTGLGLSLVYHLAEMHGGGVSVESRLGHGSHFRVSLPWNPKARAAQELQNELEEVVTENLEGSPLILVAEDNRSNIISLTAILEAHGARVVVAENGRQALEKARQKPPDLVIMDIQMPEMDGLEVMQHIRDDRRLRRLPIIALTALAMPGDRERCLAGGASDYLSKPVPQAELIGSVRSLLARKDQAHREQLLEKLRESI